MTNPFNDNPRGRDGTDPEFATLTNHGFHSLSASDVDGDCKHDAAPGVPARVDTEGSANPYTLCTTRSTGLR
jgi:rhamnogalacturonan endolyase